MAIGARHWSNDVSTSGKLIRNLFSTGKSSAHWSNASEQLHQLSEGSTATSGRSLTGSSDALPSEIPMAYAKKGRLCALCVVLESCSNLYSLCRPSLESWWLTGNVNDPPTWCRVASTSYAGDVETPILHGEAT